MPLTTNLAALFGLLSLSSGKCEEMIKSTDQDKEKYIYFQIAHLPQNGGL